MARPPGGALHDIKKKRCMDTPTEPFEFGTNAVPNFLTCMHPGGPTRRGSRPVAVGGHLFRCSWAPDIQEPTIDPDPDPTRTLPGPGDYQDLVWGFVRC